MKQLPTLLAAALLALLSASCSGSNSSGSQGNVEGFENPEQITDTETGEPYTDGGKVYFGDERNPSNGQPILTEETMLLAGTMNNGKITFDLPQSVDSRFLQKIDKNREGMKVEPLGVETWFYTDPLRLIDNSGKHIGDMLYIKRTESVAHVISYWYFSKAVKINGMEGKTKIEVNAKKGWNEIYWYMNENAEYFMTTDLSKVPDGLEWTLNKK